jgi:simple sugar transport system permease protein
MTTGRGFISLAALIFGKWTSVGALGSALLFGFSEALGVRMQFRDVNELQTLTFLVGVGVFLLGVIWAFIKIVRGAKDKRSPTLIVGTVVVGAALLAISLFVAFPTIEIPLQFLGLLPYVVTILVLAGLVGRAIPPVAIGRPYEKQ